MLEFLTGPLLLTLFLGLLCLFFLYRYSTRNFDYWEEKGIPYVKGIPFFGSILEFLWKMMNIVKQCCQTLLQNLQKVSDNGKPYKVKELYGAFSMDVIASSAFSTKLDSHNDPQNKFVQTAKKAFSTGFAVRVSLHQLMPRLMKFLGVPVFLPQPTEFFKQVTLQIIEERKRTGQTRNDFLQLLMDTAQEVAQEQKWESVSDQEDITSNYEQVDSTQPAIKTTSNKHLSLDELVGNCVIFFLAAYDTTATTLNFASYLLALNPEIQENAYKEIREVLQRCKGELTYEALQEMKYLDNIISETLRLYPPAPRLERIADVEAKLGDTGITIPKGMLVTIPSYALHKDPQYFPDPDKFDPDRFNLEERTKRNPYAYLPFGAGPRNCVGMRFALMEAKVCLAHIVANFEMQRCSETKVPLEFCLGPGVLHAKSIILKLKERKERIALK
ncbi:unnamed protein product [Larinioides sclopetarius]|uniref:Cytochrome P450 n=1 Tax=Larinioides sclopetarius TaxID=280406 RepID=A0AAV2AS97_9ARAC